MKSVGRIGREAARRYSPASSTLVLQSRFSARPVPLLLLLRLPFAPLAVLPPSPQSLVLLSLRTLQTVMPVAVVLLLLCGHCPG